MAHSPVFPKANVRRKKKSAFLALLAQIRLRAAYRRLLLFPTENYRTLDLYGGRDRTRTCDLLRVKQAL